MVVDYSLTANKYTLLDAYQVPNVDKQACKITSSSIICILGLTSAYCQAVFPLNAKKVRIREIMSGGFAVKIQQRVTKSSGF